jgi:hypothetical protein
MTHWMFRCREVSRKVSQSMDTPLPLHQRIAIRIHLMMCRYCARFRRQILALRKISRHIGDPPSGEMLSPAAKTQIKQTLRSMT